MGSCYYYMKGNNCDESKFKKIVEFLHEGSKSEDWWQDHRDYERAGKRVEFWNEFKQNFPMVYKYLTMVGLNDKDCDNELAGMIDFGDEEDVDHNVNLDGNEFKYCAYVWHFANWDGLCQFISGEFRMYNVRCVSEEDINPYDCI